MPQLFEFGAEKSSWGSTSKPHKDCPSLTERSHGTRSFTTTPTPLSETRTVGYQLVFWYPLMLQLLPQLTQGHQVLILQPNTLEQYG